MKTFLLTYNRKINGFLIIILLLLTNGVMAQATGDYRSATNNTNWSALSSWQRFTTGTGWATPTSGQGYPGQNTGTGNVIIRFGGSINLNVSPANAIGSLNVGDGTASNLGLSNNPALLSISTFTLIVTGNVTVSNSNSNRDGTLNNGSGTVKCGGAFSGTGFYTSGTGTFEYNAAGTQTVAATTYNNLTLSGSGSKTIGAVTVNGILSMEGTATASAAPTYGTTATLQYNTATARTITGASNAGIEWITPFLTGRNVIIANTGVITLNTARTLNSGSVLTVNSGATLALDAALTNSGTTNINGSLQLNSSGSVSATPTYGSASTLIYNRGSAIGHGVEWTNTGAPPVAGSGIPNNVTVKGNTSLTLTASRGMAGNLSIESGSSVKVDPLLNLAVVNSISNNGTLTIENTANLIQTNNVANTGSGTTTVKRNSSAIKRLDYTLWSSPVTGQELYAFSPLTLSTRFYQYLTATNVYNNSGLGFSISGADPVTGIGGTDTADIQFATGKGYLIRTPWNHPTAPAVWAGSFSGVANNGDIPVTVSTAGEPVIGYGYNAVGNPYPSRLSVPGFISANTNISGTLYFWRKTNDNSTTSYATLTTTAYVANGAPGGDTGTGYFPNGGGAEANWAINIGQGFFVKVNSGSTVNFTNSMRRSSNSDQFFRNSQTENTESDGLYWLNLNTSTGIYSQMAVGYGSEGTFDFDRGIDGENINKDFYLTSLINTGEYSIQGRPNFVSTDVVQLSYKVTTSGNHSISIDHSTGLFSSGQLIYLRDNLTSTIHDLTSGAYSFSSDAGTFTSRFEVMYQLPLGVGTPTFNENQVAIYQNEVKDFVINTGNIVMSNVKVFDIRGRLLLNSEGINASQTTVTVGQTNEVLLVQITSQDGLVVTKKVIR